MIFSNSQVKENCIRNEKDVFHTMMHRIAKIASGGESCSDFIKTVMMELVEKFHLDGLYIVDESRDDNKISHFYWDEDLLNKSIFLKEELSADIIQWYENKMSDNLLLEISDVASLMDTKQIEAFHNRNIHALVVTPIYSGGEASGAICFTMNAPYSWTNNELNVLHSVSIIINQLLSNEETREKIDYLSKFDKMTGLYNRGYAETQLEMMDHNSNYPLIIVVGDLNGLKVTNDAYGHECGNELLIRASEIIKGKIPCHQVAARWGGDEFLIALKNTTEEEATIICKEIKDAFEKLDSILTPNSISLGFAIKSTSAEDMGKIIRQAEDRMYEKKLLESKSLRSSIIKSMQQTLHEKSCETEEHASRLRHFSKLIGTELGLSCKELADLELLAMLHDIGKISVSNEILEKPSSLSEEEWVMMKRHSESGYRILKSIPELAHIAKYVLSHHERWDGNGYPAGLMKNDIPLLSRIISVVDAYDAMTHNRVYRKGISSEEAKEELVSNSGTQFDSTVVSVFIKIAN